MREQHFHKSLEKRSKKFVGENIQKKRIEVAWKIISFENWKSANKIAEWWLVHLNSTLVPQAQELQILQLSSQRRWNEVSQRIRVVS